MNRLLKNYKTIEVIFNTGNRGDGVINEGCKTLLNSLGITIGKSDVCLFIGAGGFSKEYKHNINRARKMFNRYRRVFIASASFDLSDGLVHHFIKTLPFNVWLVCREKESFTQCLKHTNNVLLADDFAFDFDYEPYKKQGDGTLKAFRADKEKTPLKGKDISVGKESDWDAFVKEIAEYEIVHTNRLHIGIVATMLGKEVYLYPNSYFKNKAVFDYSLSKYPNCNFIDTKYVCVGNNRTATTSLESAFRRLGFKCEGYKYKNVAQYLYGDKQKILNRVSKLSFVKDHPYFELYKDLDKSYDCKFILTLRDEKKWVKSYRKAIEQQKTNINEVLRQKTYGFNALEQTDDFLIENIYRKNNAEVMEHFKDRPQDLLVMDITKGDGWEKLCPFLDVDVPKIPFPHSNKGE